MTSSLASSHTKRGSDRIERQISYFEVERLGDSQTRTPLLKHQQLRLRVGRCSDNGIHLVGFEVLRYALFAFGSCTIRRLRVTPAGPTPAGDCGRRFSSHTAPFSSASQSRYAYRRQFVIIIFWNTNCFWSAQDLSFVGPTCHAVAPTGAGPRGFQALTHHKSG